MAASDRFHIGTGVSYALATSVVASTAAATAKLLAADLSAWLIVWVQYGLCTLVMLPWVLRQGVAALASERWRLLVVRSLAGWLGFTTYYLALPHIPLVDASLLRSAAPLWVPLLVFAWLGEHVPAIRWVALGTGFTGVCLVLRPELEGINPGHLLGLAAGLFLAASMATTRALSASEPASRVLFYYFGVSFLAASPMAIVHWQPVSPGHLPGLLYIGLSIFLTMVLYTRAYSLAPTSIIAPLSYIAVPSAAVLDWWLWGALPDAWSMAGSVLVVASGVLAFTLRGSSTGDH
ncbi:MAG: DMT family transporter [Alcanivoracaceae bacterium]|nr:DMT family transporter [Alcanivoracaceae bacterium]